MTDGPAAADRPMPDVLESGPGGAGRRRRPWVLLLVVAAGVALIGLRASGLGDQGGSGPVSAASVPAPTTQPERSAAPVRAPAPGPPACTDCRPGRFRLTARPGFGPAGLRLVVGGQHPAVLDLATGRTTPIAGLRLAADQAATLYPVDGGLVAVISVAGGGPVDSYLLRDAGGTVRLGRFDAAVPSRDGGLLAYDMGWNPPTPGRLVSFTAAGQRRWERTFRMPTSVIRDTPYGLLIQEFEDPDTGGGPLRLIEPRTGRVRQDLAWAVQVLTGTDRYVVWLSGECRDDGGPCRLIVTDLGDGRSTARPVPLRRVPGTAAMTPDGRLAVGVAGLHDFVSGSIRDGFVAVLDLATGTYTRLPGLTAQAKHVPALGWSPDGRWLLMAVQPDDQHDRLVLWRRGSAGLTVLPTVLPGWSLDSGRGLLIRPGE
jgi:hypothetical protein